MKEASPTVNGAAPKALPDAISLVVSGPDVPPGTLIPIVAVPLTCAVVVLLRRYVWEEKKTV